MPVLGVEIVGNDVGDVGNVPSCVDGAEGSATCARKGKLRRLTSDWSCHDGLCWWFQGKGLVLNYKM